VNGISTKFVCTVSVNACAPCPAAGTSGCCPSSAFCAAVSGSLLGTELSCEVELVFPFESGVVPRPGVTGLSGSICGRGASGICGFGPSGICCCGAALCCACSCAGWPSPGCPSNAHTKVPANTLLLTTPNPPFTFQPAYRSRNLSSYQTTSAPPPPPSYPTTSDTPHSPWTHRPPSTLRPAPSPLQAFFSKLSSNFVV
jgi:hypothetical protein